MVKKFRRYLIRFDMIHERDRHTDTVWRHRPRLCIASCGKNHPISMKFCTQQQILNWTNVTWSKIQKLHWTDSEFDRSTERISCCNYFWGRKINLSRISPANRSRSAANSVYVDMSQATTFREFWARSAHLGQNGDWDESRGARVFLCGNPVNLLATSQLPIFTKFGYET